MVSMENIHVGSIIQTEKFIIYIFMNEPCACGVCVCIHSWVCDCVPGVYVCVYSNCICVSVCVCMCACVFEYLCMHVITRATGVEDDTD